MRLDGGAEAGPARARSSPFLPVLEAVPAELISRTDLVWKPESVNPALLFGSPTTVPGELERSRFAASLDDYGAHEIRAAGPRVHMEALDGELRMRMEELIDEPDHLDARDVARHGDRGGLGARGKGDDVRLEGVGCAGPSQQVEVDWHGRNIQMNRRWSGSSTHIPKTKLTTESALGVEKRRRQW